LRGNNINKIDSLDGLMNLQYLDLSCNKLRNVERSNIGLLPNLNTLICDSNYLKNINSFSKLQSLVYLSFHSNKISEISNIERLAEIENLKEINLSNNPITKNMNYRVNVIRKFYNLNKIDGVEITKDEREIAVMDQTCQPSIQGIEQVHPGNIYMTKMENTKVNYLIIFYLKK
jgi:Leucine-rich repeat (LRR) protein